MNLQNRKKLFITQWTWAASSYLQKHETELKTGTSNKNIQLETEMEYNAEKWAMLKWVVGNDK